jgi:DNA polymerase-4
VFVTPDFPSYIAYSNRFREILLGLSPVVEPISLDEAFIDVSGAVLLFGSPMEIGALARSSIQAELALTASVGIGATKLIAKLASVRAKPDGLLAVPADGTLAFLHPLPVAALWGIGEKTAEVLGRLGIRTVGELARTPPAILERVLGEAQSRSLVELSAGRDGRSVVPFEAPKSVSHEETYPRDLDREDDALREILGLSHKVASRLRAEGYRARTVTLKLRLPSFSTLTRSRTLAAPTDLAADIFHVSHELLAKLPAGRRRFRLIGVAATGLIPAGAEQLALHREGRWQEAERALDRVQLRFGKGAALPAALLRGPQA